ncbi:MAG: riboflavin synthase [Thermanaeromonas sp.]|uniref:riboflavin synthase n=1 Tax=Thermanaeromonas sp. TaxID=2003697 RepID=UPI00243B18DD|nr:riboflavin synthase [Thermanaeromonas sp.]MCG0276913.1 riboflavin synthase [Thermanaeromonas sp.]
MFTGIIEEIGRVREVEVYFLGARLVIQAQKVLEGTKVGDSIAVNGACLTVVEIKKGAFVAEVMEETLKVTNLGRLKVGESVNLERALRWGDRMGGHLVSGHVDGVGRILGRRPVGRAQEITVSLPEHLKRYVVPKGSIALDGTSLTVIERRDSTFKVGLIPHTLHTTILGSKGVGEEVNIEVDLIARYLEGLCGLEAVSSKIEQARERGITLEFLSRYGFI